MSEEGHGSEFKVLDNGKLVAEYRAPNFLDGQEKEQHDDHSTRVCAIVRKIVETDDTRTYRNSHTMVMVDQQNSITWSNGELADRLEQLGVADETVSEARPGVGITKAKVSANVNSDDLKKRLGKVSSPYVFVGGRDILENIPSDDGLGQQIEMVLCQVPYTLTRFVFSSCLVNPL